MPVKNDHRCNSPIARAPHPRASRVTKRVGRQAGGGAVVRAAIGMHAAAVIDDLRPRYAHYSFAFSTLLGGGHGFPQWLSRVLIVQ
jgi:hypothetical protein